MPQYSFKSDFYDQESGPLRVWLQSEDTPGLAVTRSMGDLIGKKCGVTADPGNEKDFYNSQKSPNTSSETDRCSSWPPTASGT